MQTLEEISIELREIKTLLKPSTERVYINSSEVQRLLDITFPTLQSFTENGLLKIQNTKTSNKYLLSEVLWVKEQKYKNLSITAFERLITLKNLTYDRGNN